MAASSGLTARTLHHWEEPDLVVACVRGPGGHSEHTSDDLGRLYAASTLRGLAADAARRHTASPSDR